MNKTFKVVHWEKFSPEARNFPQHQVVLKEYTELSEKEAQQVKEELEKALSDSFKKMKAPEGHDAFYLPESKSNREYHSWIQIYEEK